MFESIFITDLDQIDIDCDRVVCFDCFDELAGYIIGSFEEILGFDIVVKELNTFADTFDNFFTQCNLALVLYTALFDELFCVCGKLSLEGMDLIGIRLTLGHVDAAY